MYLYRLKNITFFDKLRFVSFLSIVYVLNFNINNFTFIFWSHDKRNNTTIKILEWNFHLNLNNVQNIPGEIWINGGVDNENNINSDSVMACFCIAHVQYTRDPREVFHPCIHLIPALQRQELFAIDSDTWWWECWHKLYFNNRLLHLNKILWIFEKKNSQRNNINLSLWWYMWVKVENKGA